LAPIVEAKNLTKKYKGDVEALRGVSFQIDPNEFFILMGPSGCGKSTLLKIIAGILDFDGGELYISGRNVKDVPPHRRDVSMMLESFALFPHMTVYDNLAYGLKMLGRDRTEVDKETKEMLRILQIEGLEHKMPSQISGGQKQRVALARALVIRPTVLLLDEPLSHVDYRLQRRFAEMLKEVHREIGGVFMLSTHDQEHGLSLGDRVMIMNSGLIEQTGSPSQIYNEPETLFAAKFVGELNVLAGTAEDAGPDGIVVRTELGTFRARAPRDQDPRELLGRRVAYIFRPENVLLGADSENKVTGRFDLYYYFGQFVEMVFKVSEHVRIKAVVPANSSQTVKLGQEYTLGWSSKNARVVSRPSVLQGVDVEELIYGK